MKRSAEGQLACLVVHRWEKREQSMVGVRDVPDDDSHPLWAAFVMNVLDGQSLGTVF